MTTSAIGWREGIGMLALSVEAHRTGCAVVVATGELDLAGARRVLDRMDRLVSEGRDRIVLDMSGVAFCGAQAMSALVRTRARAQRAGGWLRLAAVPPHVRRVFERTDLDRLFPRYPDVASAATGRAVASGEERGAAAGGGARAVSGVTVSRDGRVAAAGRGGRVVSRGGRPAAAGDAGRAGSGRDGRAVPVDDGRVGSGEDGHGGGGW
ncbi:anti-anti-sigma factor [Saccharothrix carnea]|uniref:Anti-anti-sigma factor n=1 Tax=Saccharothrix carnea TaxID=1280637 RepID=A0A2P8I2Y0_SACCR|nr:STAS domain-containing protein [Saccharothrix carnea]PSL52831.1 anti-anti-sigma factor [Saccharothrix carnea]